MPHQAEAIAWGESKDSIGLFHEMRLGKTLTTTRWAENKPAQRILVAAPLAVLDAWQDELAAEGHHSCSLLGSQDQRLRIADEHVGRWFLINNEGLVQPGFGKTAVPSPIAELPWDMVIIDESATIKNPKAKISKVACGTLAQARYKAVLSGLPNPSSVIDFFQQMKFLLGEFMGFKNFYSWRVEFFEPDPMGWGWVALPGTNKKIRAAMEPHCSFLTRKDVNLHNEKVFVRRYVDLPAKVRKAYDEAEADFSITGDSCQACGGLGVLGEIPDAVVCGTCNGKGSEQSSFSKWKVVTRNWCSQLTGGRLKGHPALQHDAKMKLLKELLGGELEGEQLLVWCYQRAEAHGLEKYLRNSCKVKVRKVIGGVDSRLRRKYLSQFRAGKVQVLVLQVRTMKYGVDLSCCSTAFYYSLTENPDDFYQSIERIEHPKKKEQLLYIMACARDTIDVDKLNSLKVKHATSRSFNRDVMQKMRDRHEAKKS